MEVSKASNDDGIVLIDLIKLLNTGRWDMSGQEAEKMVKVKQWVHSVANQVAPMLRTSASPAPATPPSIPVPVPSSFRIKTPPTPNPGTGRRKKKN